MEITDDDLREMGKNLSDGKYVTPEFQHGINTLVAYMSMLANFTDAISKVNDAQTKAIMALEKRIAALESRG